MKVSIGAAFVVSMALFSANSHASIITTGVPVDSNGDPLNPAVLASNVSADGTIRFYNPLSGGYAGVFGVSGVGLTGGGFDGTGGPGSLDMFLSFSPTAGGNALAFYFEDMDLIGVNDPFWLLESISVYNQDMSTLIAMIDDANDPEVIQANKNNQNLLVSLSSVMPLGDPFIARLRFTAGPVYGYNTPEKVKVQLIGVPEPSSYLIFAIGLLGLGVISVRRREQTAGGMKTHAFGSGGLVTRLPILLSDPRYPDLR